MTPPFAPWLFWMLDAAIATVLLALALTLLRLLRGPDALDRLLALDTLYLNAAALLLLWDIRTAQSILFEAALMIVSLGFIGTTAAARYLARRSVVE